MTAAEALDAILARYGCAELVKTVRSDRDALAADLAAARALLREAQDVIYDGKPNARGDIELLRRIDAALAGDAKC
jgi:hypothetical protein